MEAQKRVFHGFIRPGKSEFAEISFSNSFTHLQCTKILRYAHTHLFCFILCYVLGSTASRLYCSLLIFRVRNWEGGKRQNRRRIQGSLSCSAPCPVQMHTSGSPYAGRGLQGGGGRGTPSTCPALTGLSPPSPECSSQAEGPAVALRQQSGGF